MNSAALTEGRESPSPVLPVTRIARAISWIGHPLVFMTVSLAVVIFRKLANRVGLSVWAALFICVILPTAFLLLRGVRSGRWSDADVSIRTERTHFYPRAILLSLFGMTALSFLRAPGFVLRGACVTLALLLLAAAINQRIKLSLHAMFAVFCAVVLFAISGLAGAIASALALLVFWSRLQLRRHDLLEMLIGTVLGVAGGIGAAWWP